jgi:hypothetical protein
MVFITHCCSGLRSNFSVHAVANNIGNVRYKKNRHRGGGYNVLQFETDPDHGVSMPIL